VKKKYKRRMPENARYYYQFEFFIFIFLFITESAKFVEANLVSISVKIQNWYSS
jgi:hypothetical protein